MPKVSHRKARKDYPESGIKKGDMYYYTSLKLQRGGLVKRSLTPFRESQLTTSPFKSGWFAITEAWADGDKDSGAMREAAESLRELGNECQESFDNMPEGLQQGDTGQMLEERISGCEEKADELESFADELDELGSEPEPFDDTESPEDDPSYDERFEEWQQSVDEHAVETARIPEEAEDIFSDMPE